MNLLSFFRPKPIRPFIAKIVEMLDAGDYQVKKRPSYQGEIFRFALEQKLLLDVWTDLHNRVYCVSLASDYWTRMPKAERVAMNAALTRIRERKEKASRIIWERDQAAAIAKIEAYTVVPRNGTPTP